MRTIKFRGKDIMDDHWVYGDLHVLCDRPHIHTEPTAYPYAGRRSFVNPATVGQFTGLKDRNGNEVYEGDILMVEGIKYPRYHIVSWDERKFMFCIDETPLYAYLHGDTLLREYVVCGNVFDNLDLIKKGGER